MVGGRSVKHDIVRFFYHKYNPKSDKLLCRESLNQVQLCSPKSIARECADEVHWTEYHGAFNSLANIMISEEITSTELHKEWESFLMCSVRDHSDFHINTFTH